MKKYILLFFCAALLLSCIGAGNNGGDGAQSKGNRLTSIVKEKLAGGLESLAAKMEGQERKKDSLDLIEARKQVAKDEVKMVPPPEWSVMRLIPEIPSAEDLVAGNTAEYLAALEQFNKETWRIYENFTDSVAHNRAQLARFGHTQAELDAMSEEEKNQVVMKAYNKINEEQAVKQKVIEQEAAKLDGSSLGGILKSMAQLQQRQEQAEEDAKNKFFEENAEILPLIDEYHRIRSEHSQWINVSENEKHHEYFNIKGVAKMELWRKWYIEVQQKFHALAPLAREADQNMLKVKMPAKKSRETSRYDFMNEFNLNRHYYEFMKSITEKDTGIDSN